MRLPAVRSLYEILPKGTEGGKEFARIIDLLLFQEARRAGNNVTLFNDASGDYHGLDSFERDALRRQNTTGYQYKFYPSPLSAAHRKEIVESLKKSYRSRSELKLQKWIIITPQDLTESSVREDKGDVSWFEGLKKSYPLLDIEHWGHTKLQYLFLETPALCLYYYPELTKEGATTRKTILDTKKRYDDGLIATHGNIEFVGMSVYKQEATRGVPMEHIYIPLTAVPEGSDEREDPASRINPLSFLEPGKHSVILGDPGSGKSTLQKFLALSGIHKSLQKRYKVKPNKRIPILVTLRRYADEIKSNINLSLIDYILDLIQADLSLKAADFSFLEYYLESGQTILLFDGLDELPNPHYKQIVRDRIRTLISTYPGNTVIVTSRIVGYDNPFRFNQNEMGHYRLTNLQLPEIEKFVRDWYEFRIENETERSLNVDDLVRILKDEDHIAIRELAENPLLLTIVALVHRVDAVLPDERVVLYQKCTETLLNTWHTWKFREAEGKNRGKIERQHRRRMEALANWMHTRSVGTNVNARAVSPYAELKNFLTDYIEQVEKPNDPFSDAEDFAEEFIEFIKKRAGLIIEVGDDQYSFIHLTFQEYLSSSYIITNNETLGVSGIWKAIKTHCNDSRWHEVIRLLIAELRSDDAKEWLIKEIIALKNKRDDVLRCQLLGGLLLDGIQAAEDHAGEILEQLVIAAISTKNTTQLRSINSTLKIWAVKEKGNSEILDKAFLSAYDKGSDANLQKSAHLVAISVSNSRDSLLSLTKNCHLDKDELTEIFFYPAANSNYSDEIYSGLATLSYIQDECSITSPSMNLLSVAIEGLNQSLPLEYYAKRAFIKQISTFSSTSTGPFAHFNLNAFRMASHKDKEVFKWIDESFKKDISLSRWSKSLLYRTWRKVASIERSSIPQEFLLKRPDIRDFTESVLDVEHTKMVDPSLFFSSSRRYAPLLDVLCFSFNLEPRPQWWEALRHSFLPTIPSNIRMYDPAFWSMVTDEISGGSREDSHLYSGAWILLLDTWLQLAGYHESNAQKFNDLAEITRTIEFPPMEVAHMVRDLAYGKDERAKDLIDASLSSEPTLQEIFASFEHYPLMGRRRVKANRQLRMDLN